MAHFHCEYRIVREEKIEHGQVRPCYTLREVFFDDAGGVLRVAPEDAAPCGGSITELIIDIDRMLRACALAVLELPKGE